MKTLLATILLATLATGAEAEEATDAEMSRLCQSGYPDGCSQGKRRADIVKQYGAIISQYRNMSDAALASACTAYNGDGGPCLAHYARMK